jgi:hypothetical protein
LESEFETPEPAEEEPDAYVPPAVVASYSIDELRRAAATTMAY